jgi:hypothetical protein
MNVRTLTIVSAVVFIGIIILIMVLKTREKYASSEPTYPLPPGNYQNTCKNAKMVGTTLEAQCLNGLKPADSVDNADIYIPSSLKDANKCSYVVNSMYMSQQAGHQPVYSGILSCQGRGKYSISRKQ